ncbi:MAG: hypothetical protein MMC23_009364 [Stictis urceolatum]|nr:hypothetical protein [Stictis urceolata]
MAKFIVPLDINKLDLKDYLYYAYNIPVLAVRSYIIQPPLTRGGSGNKNPQSWHRPRSTKFMIVEMQDPFVWPEEEKDLEGWDKKAFLEAEKAQRQLNERSVLKGLAPRLDVDIISKQAKELREGKEAWRPTWMEIRNAAGSRSEASS